MGESVLKSEEDPPIRRGTSPLHIDFEIEKKNHQAFSYSKLVWMDFNISGVIHLHFASHTVKLVGQRLRPLYDSILLHEIAFVRMEPSRHETGGKEKDPVVTKIVISPVHGKPERFGMGTPVAGEDPNE